MAKANTARNAEILRLRASGVTLREICERLGISKSMVNRVLYPAVRAYEKSYNRDRWYVARCRRCDRLITHNKYAQKSRGLWCRDCYDNNRSELLALASNQDTKGGA